ncbi:hypothetical protein FHG87_005922 [Trinorchestia longiramus]|nr:hypothetical protein FHG87_005922 [Trinorchestia longiramus]
MRLDFRYDRKFYIDQSENKSTEVDTVMRLGLVTTGSTALTNEWSRSGSRAQPTAQYKEAATFCVTTNPMNRPPPLNTCVQSAHFYSPPSIPFRFIPILRHTLCQTLPQIFPTGADLPTCATNSLPNASKVNISTKTSYHLKKSTYSQQQSEGSRNQPSCLLTG